MKLSVYLACLGAAAHAQCTATETSKATIFVPSSQPDNALVVPQDFVGFGIEAAFLNNYANNFSEHLVSSLAARMSKPPILRIGGTSGDYFTFNPEQEVDKVCVSKGCNGHKAHYILGSTFFDGFSGFKDANMIIQAPLQNPVNMSNTLSYLWQAWNSLGNGSRVEAIALGNEVEFIYQSGVDDYVEAALTIQEGIIKNLSLSGGEARIFEAGNTASGTVTTLDPADNDYTV
jgi:hypothetical protein